MKNLYIAIKFYRKIIKFIDNLEYKKLIQNFLFRINSSVFGIKIIYFITHRGFNLFANLPLDLTSLKSSKT